MSIIVNNTDGQLNINSNGVLDVYSVRSIKSVSRGFDASGNYYIAINFIANDKNNSLRIYLNDVISPVSWTNTLAGANAALADIRDWLGEVIEVEINQANDSILIYGFDGADNQPVAVDNTGALAIQDNGGSITVDGGAGLLRTTGMIRPSGTSGNLNTIAPQFYSVSIANVGSNPGTVLGQTIKAGEVLNFSADAINNYFNSFAYNAGGTDFIIIYVA
jgi:hypothetical protein